MLEEVVPTPTLDSNEVLVFVMAAGVNYNGVWASLGTPISPFDVHKADFHVAGSDASGIVWAVGDKVKRWKVGDQVVIHCNQDDGDADEGTAEAEKDAMQSNPLHVLPLHGALPAADQSRVFGPPPRGKVKVVVATNIAETSITISDCTIVIDSCRCNMRVTTSSRL